MLSKDIIQTKFVTIHSTNIFEHDNMHRIIYSMQSFNFSVAVLKHMQM